MVPTGTNIPTRKDKLGFTCHKAMGLQKLATELHTRRGGKILAHWLCSCMDGKIWGLKER